MTCLTFDPVEVTREGVDRRKQKTRQRVVEEQCERRSSVDEERFTVNTPLHHDDHGVTLRFRGNEEPAVNKPAH